MALILKKDAEKMRGLAHEGKQISRIVADNFPSLDYGDVYWAVYGKGERSSQGIKKMISFRIQKLVDAQQSQQERKRVAQELNALTTVPDNVRTAARVDPPNRTSLLKLVGKVAAQNPAFGERLREILAGKPE